MNEVAITITTPYPMEGFEGESLDTAKFYSRFRQIGDFLKEKREQYYIQGSAAITSLSPARQTYYLSKPREDTIEFLTFPQHSEETLQPPPPEPTKVRAGMYLDAFYGVFVSYFLAGLKAQFAGELTRAIELPFLAPRPRNKSLPEGWIRQRKVRIKQAILQRTEAKDAFPEWNKWFQKVEQALLLEEGWNGDDAPAPEVVAALQATMLLKAMRRADYQPTRIAASAMGGIAITRKVGNKKVLVEFYNDGRVYYLFSDRSSGNMDVKALLLDQDSLTRFIALMREYLDG
jgi:hypothetical protein